MDMAWVWQLWLSPRPLRSVIASDPYIMSPYDGARFDFLKDEDGRWAVRETHYIDNPWVKDGLSGPTLYVPPNLLSFHPFLGVCQDRTI